MNGDGLVYCPHCMRALHYVEPRVDEQWFRPFWASNDGLRRFCSAQRPHAEHTIRFLSDAVIVADLRAMIAELEAA